MIPKLRPSVSLDEYREVEAIAEHVPEASTHLVPNTRLRYWVEALHEDKYGILGRPAAPLPWGSYLVLEAKERGPPLPPVFDGRFIKVYPLKPRQ